MRPPRHVLAALGCRDEPQPLGGGQGTSWRCGAVVVKPIDRQPQELEWQADVLASIDQDDFRVPGFRGTADGWCAWEYVQGEHRERAWPDILAVGESFHRALEDVPRPSLLDWRTDRWAIADQVAWNERPWQGFADVPHVERLVDALRPVDERGSQLVHSDLTRNVLFADGLRPAVIDFSPSWRPPAFASAVVVADALAWEGADESLLDAVAHVDEFPQHLLRALLFRIVVDALFRANEEPRSDADDSFRWPVELACALAQ